MLGSFKVTYTVQRWTAIAQGAGVLGAAVLLCVLFGGFPPRPWLFLWQTLTRLPALWAERGSAVLLPLAGLLVLCLTLLLAWGTLVFMTWLLAKRGWAYLHEQQRFEQEVREAEFLAMSEVRRWTMPRAMSRPLQATIGSSAPTRPVPSTPRPSRPLQASTGSSAPTRPAPSAPRPSRPLVPEQRPVRGPWADLPTQVNFPQPLRQEPPSLSGVPTRHLEDGTTQQFEVDGLRLLVGSATDPGLKRKQKPNEDNLFFIQKKRARNGQPFGLFVVADGMGGHSNGREASRLAIQAFGEVTIPALVNSVENDDEFFSELLLDGLQHANLLLHQKNKAQKADMGTTITVALLVGGSAYVVNVGDSRTYLYRPATGLAKVTQDHSVVERLVNEGAITPEEVYTHPQRNQIYRCMGEKAAVDADAFVTDVLKGDKLLLCSDGLWEMVRDPQIEKILALNTDPTQTCKYLIQAALDGGGDDNVSVVVVQVEQVP